MARCYETGLVQMTELKFDSQLSDPRIETLQHPSPSSGLADTEQTAFGKCQRGFMETSPRFCLPQAPLWSLACAVAAGKEPFLCSLGGLTRSTFQASMGKAINLDVPFF